MLRRTLHSGIVMVLALAIAACGAVGGGSGPGVLSEGSPMPKPFAPPKPPLPDPKPDGLTLTLTKFVTLPKSSTSPKVPRGDKLDRHNRINYLGELPDGSGRLFVPDLNGTLYVIAKGKPHVYLDATDEIGSNLWTSQGFGSGFGFAAFHPDFQRNGVFYTVHTEAYDALTSETPNLGPTKDAVVHGVITEWTASDPAASTFAGKRREVMRLGFPAFIHGIQQISFNPYAKRGSADYGMLYVSVGDGNTVGRAAEDGHLSGAPQDLSIPQGKILRIDPRAKADESWGVPTDNPNFGGPRVLGEIYAVGLRDPYRFSWDRALGKTRMLLGSMGENRVESIYDVQGGDNFGWPDVEGPFESRLLKNCEVAQIPGDPSDWPDFTYPVAAYSHLPAAGSGPCDDTGYAVIGGFVYRGKLKDLQGQYVFGDGVNGRVFHTDASMMGRGNELAPVHDVTLLNTSGHQITMREIASDPKVLTAGKPRVDLRFGRDGKGELYVLSKSNGTIWKVTDASWEDK